MTRDTAGDRIGAFVAGLRFEDLPPAVVHEAGRMLLDAVGCALAAWTEDSRKAGIAVKLADDFHADGRASVIGGGRTHPALAALANAMMVNAADNDDTHKRALLHVGSVVVPTALAMAEQHGLDGRGLVLALVAGYEVAARVGMAVMPTHYRFWHSTATNGTFGAAAAAAKALRLDAAGVRTALGFAATQAAGLNTFFESGDDTKSLHPGKAALNGVLSARLAALGATSPPDVFGHPKGYLAAYSTEPDAARLTRDLGQDWEILQNGYKPYPSILASHSPIGAALDIAARHRPDPARIAAVHIHTYETVRTHFAGKQVESTMAARLSVPYCVAAALADGEITQAQFRPERFRAPEIRRLLERTEVIADADLSRLYPEKFPARVVVRLEDGELLEATLMFPKGDPQNPLSDAELATKFRANAAARMAPSAMDRLVAISGDLPALADLEALTAPLRA